MAAEYELNPQSPSFDFFMTYTLNSVTVVNPKYVPGPFTMELSNTCTAPCTGGAPAEGQAQVGGYVELHDIFTDRTVLHTPTFTTHFNAYPTSGEPGPEGTLSGAPAVRCDNGTTVGSANYGCVEPLYTPTLALSLAGQGAGAAMVAWSITNLPGQFGTLASPMLRYAGTPAWSTQKNRDVACDKTFVPDASGTDSCDEYAFAASYQSAGITKTVTSGSQCAEITPYQSGGKWYVKTQNADTSKNCARGHVTLNSNTAVGGLYGNMVRSQRVMDKDKFYVLVSA